MAINPRITICITKKNEDIINAFITKYPLSYKGRLVELMQEELQKDDKKEVKEESPLINF